MKHPLLTVHFSSRICVRFTSIILVNHPLLTVHFSSRICVRSTSIILGKQSPLCSPYSLGVTTKHPTIYRSIQSQKENIYVSYRIKIKLSAAYKMCSRLPNSKNFALVCANIFFSVISSNYFYLVK